MAAFLISRHSGTTGRTHGLGTERFDSSTAHGGNRYVGICDLHTHIRLNAGYGSRRDGPS